MTTRQDKVQELIKEEVCYVLQREFRDSRLGFVTIIEVDVSKDMQYAKVFVSIFGNEEERTASLNILKKAEPFFRLALSKRLKMRHVPKVDFRLDTSADKSIRIMELLNEIKDEDGDATS